MKLHKLSFSSSLLPAETSLSHNLLTAIGMSRLNPSAANFEPGKAGDSLVAGSSEIESKGSTLEASFAQTSLYNDAGLRPQIKPQTAAVGGLTQSSHLDGPLTSSEVESAMERSESGEYGSDDEDDIPVKIKEKAKKIFAKEMTKELNLLWMSDVPPKAKLERDATFYVLLKQGADPDICSSYRPGIILDAKESLLQCIAEERWKRSQPAAERISKPTTDVLKVGKSRGARLLAGLLGAREGVRKEMDKRWRAAVAWLIRNQGPACGGRNARKANTLSDWEMGLLAHGIQPTKGVQHWGAQRLSWRFYADNFLAAGVSFTSFKGSPGYFPAMNKSMPGVNEGLPDAVCDHASCSKEVGGLGPGRFLHLCDGCGETYCSEACKQAAAATHEPLCRLAVWGTDEWGDYHAGLATPGPGRFIGEDGMQMRKDAGRAVEYLAVSQVWADVTISPLGCPPPPRLTVLPACGSEPVQDSAAKERQSAQASISAGSDPRRPGLGIAGGGEGGAGAEAWEGRVCGACGARKTKEAYSKNQWKQMQAQARCKACVAAGIELEGERAGAAQTTVQRDHEATVPVQPPQSWRSWLLGDGGVCGDALSENAEGVRSHLQMLNVPAEFKAALFRCAYRHQPPPPANLSSQTASALESPLTTRELQPVLDALPEGVPECGQDLPNELFSASPPQLMTMVLQALNQAWVQGLLMQPKELVGMRKMLAGGRLACVCLRGGNWDEPACYSLVPVLRQSARLLQGMLDARLRLAVARGWEAPARLRGVLEAMKAERRPRQEEFERRWAAMAWQAVEGRVGGKAAATLGSVNTVLPGVWFQVQSAASTDTRNHRSGWQDLCDAHGLGVRLGGVPSWRRKEKASFRVFAQKFLQNGIYLAPRKSKPAAHPTDSQFLCSGCLRAGWKESAVRCDECCSVFCSEICRAAVSVHHADVCRLLALGI